MGIDIDNCVASGIPNPSALNLLEQLGCAYVEVSPSGNGLRSFGYAEGLATGCKGKYDGLDVELYSTGRYLTLTGHTIVHGAVSQLNGFKALADRIRAGRVINHETGETNQGTAAKRHGDLVGRILSGDVYHDSLRDLAASLVATGMNEGAVVNHLRGLMENTSAPHDGRWDSRFREIPNLVSSAALKYKGSMRGSDASLIESTSDGIVMVDARYKVLSAEELTRTMPLKWLIRGLYPLSGLVGLYGPSGSGKSFLALDLAISVAGGADEWYGRRITNRPVTYCVLEGEAGMGKRLEAWAQHHDKQIPAALRFITQPVDLLNGGDVQELAQAIGEVGGAEGLIILDTLNRAAPVADENSSKDMGSIIAAAKRLQDLTGGVVMLVHHTGKVVHNGMRGHSSLFAAMDGLIAVTSSKDHAQSWCVDKSKDDATGAAYPFRLEQVAVGIDEEGDEITSCVAVPLSSPLALRKSKALSKHQVTARDVLMDLCATAGDVSGQIPIDVAVDAVANQINVGARHKRQRAKEAIEALVLKSVLQISDTHVGRI